MIPDDIDLIYWKHGEVSKMSACTADWLSAEVDSKGAIGPLAREIVQKFPELFATEKDAQSFLTIRHFHNMSRKVNVAGLSYPTILE